MICCGQLSLLAWVNSSYTSRETLNKHIEILSKLLSGNSPPANSHLASNMPSTESLKNLSEYQYTMSTDTSREVVSETSMLSDSPDTITEGETEGEIEPVRVEQIKNLYDSDVILSHDVKKTKWIRNRMIA